MLNEVLSQDSLRAAPLLLGWRLVRQTPQGVIEAMIVETEAYHQDDPASHSFSGLTPRTAPMFEAGGTIYVYFTYGMHYCMNIVTGPEGRGEAVLLRAAEPLKGIDIMKGNRGVGDLNNLANGPGKLAQALGIKDTLLSGRRLGPETLWLEPPLKVLKKENIVIDRRVGIRKAIDLEARFYIKDSPFVSKTHRRVS